MTKADYVHLLKEACGGHCNAEYNPCAFRQAADNLAKLKPVTWIYNGQIHHFDPTGWALDAPTIRPLYLLEEDNK
jgi:hypothetical protein